MEINGGSTEATPPILMAIRTSVGTCKDHLATSNVIRSKVRAGPCPEEMGVITASPLWRRLGVEPRSSSRPSCSSARPVLELFGFPKNA